jgi:hypothetical protein
MSASTATETISTQFTDSTASSFFTTSPKEFIQCMAFNFKMLFAISFAILILCVCISCINSMLVPMRMEDEDDSIRYDPAIINRSRFAGYMKCKCLNGKCMCKSNLPINKNIETFENSEHFSNNEIYSFKSAQASNYQSIPLLAPDNENMFFGQAKRFITSVDDVLNYRLEIYCNLFVLDGNIFDKTPTKSVKHTYSAILRNTKKKGTLKVGDLVKDGDGIYKLKYTTQKDVEELVKYDTVDIIYSLNDNDQLLLTGKFH